MHKVNADQKMMALSAGAVEYTDWISEERKDSLDGCPVYDTKQSDGEAPVVVDML